MVVDIRGTHGSGKSWIVHELLRRYPNVSLMDKERRILGYDLGYRDCWTAVVGKYDNECGGCDGIKSADEVVSRVKWLADEYENVVLEGILVAHTFQRYSDLASRFESGDRPQKYTFCFLDTPMELCIERVKARRQKAGKTKPFNPDNLIKDWHQIWERTQAKCRSAGHRVIVLDHRDPMPQIVKLLTTKKKG